MFSKSPNGVSKPDLPLDKLSNTITENASILSHYLQTNQLPQPSSEGRGPSVILPDNSPQSVQQARQSLISACLELSQLATGPSEFLPNLALGFHYVSCLRWLCHYDVFHIVPSDDAVSYNHLATATHVPEQRLKSIIRMAMTISLFHEQSDGQSIKHSATSALIARNDDVFAYATYMSARSAPMALDMTTAHQRWGPDSTRTDETAYNVAFNTDLPFFDYIAQDSARMEEFAAYMRSVRSSDAVHIKHLVHGFPWQDISSGGRVVDVGGSTGTSAIALAKSFSHLNFVVQDLHANADHGRMTASESLPKNIASRITFQGHDFTQPQPVQGADVYLMRMILHDWSDNDAANIIQNIIPAMIPTKSRLLIMDTVLPKPGSLPVSVERLVRVRDLTMLQAFNSKERDLDDWKKLFALANPNLQLKQVREPFGSVMSILELAIM